MGEWSCSVPGGVKIETALGKGVEMKGNKFIRILLVIAGFWALFALYTP